MQKSTQPEWLHKWLNLQFYANVCEKHRMKYHTVYCGSCNNGRPACEVCWETNSDQHDNKTHQILKVRIASRRVSTDVKEIRKFLDVSKIQTYKINNKSTVFLNSKPEAEAAPNGAQSMPNCRTCGISLKKDDKGFGFEFCSIACKYYPREEVDDFEEKKSDDDEEKSKYNINCNSNCKLKRNNDECCKVLTSLRKKSRKQENPSVAPLK